MIFRKTGTTFVTLRGGKFFNFEITPEEKEEGMKRTSENPLLLWRERGVWALYNYRDELMLEAFYSYYYFKEGIGKHELKQNIDSSNGKHIQCDCGEWFRDSKRITAQQRFQKHKIEILRTENKLLGKEDIGAFQGDFSERKFIAGANLFIKRMRKHGAYIPK